ncbi:MAG: PIN domain-containing protein [Acidobacteria bacterium]|nr:PIN domain-containing protein [Acidobacteriota bacterium]
MIATDTSSWIAYLSGDAGRDTAALDAALQSGQAVLPPVVLAELLSDPELPAEVKGLFTQLPLLEIFPGYWERAGILRSRLLSRALKSPLADTLIAQSCLDHDLILVTRDHHFQSFARHAGLKLV